MLEEAGSELKYPSVQKNHYHSGPQRLRLKETLPTDMLLMTG